MRRLAQVSIGNEYWIRPNTGVSTLGSLGNLTSALLSNVYILAGVLLLLLMIGGGVTMIAGAGSNKPESIAKGQKAITGALIGFLIIFASYWIIQIVGVITGLDILGGLGL